MWRRLAIAASLAAFGVGAFVLVLVRSEAGGRQICELAVAALHDATKDRVVIGRCRVDPLTTRVVIEGVEVGPAERPIFSAERLSAGIDTRGLGRGRVRGFIGAARTGV